MTIYLEHANITVPNIDEAIDFLITLEPTFYVRTDDVVKNSHRWVHLGNEHTYIALQEPAPQPDSSSKPKKPHRTYVNFGINHLAFVVTDFEAVTQRLSQGGYLQGLLVAPSPYRKRAYYFDNAGFEWEIIQYMTDLDLEKNDYAVE